VRLRDWSLQRSSVVTSKNESAWRAPTLSGKAARQHARV
jgi:hypothetical protein